MSDPLARVRRAVEAWARSPQASRRRADWAWQRATQAWLDSPDPVLLMYAYDEEADAE